MVCRCRPSYCNLCLHAPVCRVAPSILRYTGAALHTAIFACTLQYAGLHLPFYGIQVPPFILQSLLARSSMQGCTFHFMVCRSRPSYCNLCLHAPVCRVAPSILWYTGAALHTAIFACTLQYAGLHLPFYGIQVPPFILQSLLARSSMHGCTFHFMVYRSRPSYCNLCLHAPVCRVAPSILWYTGASLHTAIFACTLQYAGLHLPFYGIQVPPFILQSLLARSSMQGCTFHFMVYRCRPSYCNLCLHAPVCRVSPSILWYTGAALHTAIFACTFHFMVYRCRPSYCNLCLHAPVCRVAPSILWYTGDALHTAIFACTLQYAGLHLPFYGIHVPPFILQSLLARSSMQGCTFHFMVYRSRPSYCNLCLHAPVCRVAPSILWYTGAALHTAIFACTLQYAGLHLPFYGIQVPPFILQSLLARSSMQGCTFHFMVYRSRPSQPSSYLVPTIIDCHDDV